jgi:hypothetical protein
MYYQGSTTQARAAIKAAREERAKLIRSFWTMLFAPSHPKAPIGKPALGQLARA